MMIDKLWHDLRMALRSLSRRPGLSAVVVLTLALGIGSTTAIFSVVNGVLLRPLPYEDASRLAMIWENDRATGTVREQASVHDFIDFRERSREFDVMAIYATGNLNLTRASGEPRRLRVVTANADLLGVLGVSPALGREFTAAEDVPGGEQVVLLTHAFWRDAFAAAPDVVGSSIRLNDRGYTVIGVLPAGFDFPDPDYDLWTSLQRDATNSGRARHDVNVLGRLAADSSFAQAADELDSIAADLEASYRENANRGVLVEPLTDYRSGGAKTTLWLLFGAVTTVLAIACANVANLLLAQGAGRAQETAVYVALGASNARLARRFLAEGLVLTGLALLAGGALSIVGLRALLTLAPPQLLGRDVVGLDAWVLLFAAGTSALIGIGCGLLPTLQSRRVNVQSALKEGRSQAEAAAVSKLFMRRCLVAGQTALAVVLLVAAALLIGTLRNLQGVDPGFRADNVLRADLQLPDSRYPRAFQNWPDWPERRNFYSSLLERVRALPGVRAATLASQHPLQAGFTNSFGIVGIPYDSGQGEITIRLVSPTYFDTVGATLLHGRLMDATDDARSEPVAIINEAARQRYFAQLEPLEHALELPWAGIPRRVIGVIENERTLGLDRAAPPAMYVNLLQAPAFGVVTLMVHTDADPLDMAAPVRTSIWSLDPDLAVYNIDTMTSTLAAAMARERFASTILGIFSLIALFLAALGVYGVLSYLVSQRRHEVGVRMALGASSADVLRMVVGQSGWMIGSGLAIGLLLAVGASRWITTLLFEVSPTEPSTYLAVVICLLLAAAVASVLPARRAAAIDPAVSLRGE